MERDLRPLSERELQEIVENWIESDDGLDFSDDDDVADPTYVVQLDDNEYSNDELSEEDAIQNYGDSEIVSTTACSSALIVPEATNREEGVTKAQKSDKPERLNVVWKNKNLELNEEQTMFRGSSTLPSEILELETPFQIFSHLFSDDIIDLIRDQTNLYSVQKDANKPVNVTSVEIRQFLGIIYFMSVIHMPNVKMYWSEKVGFAPIKETMTSKRFEQLRQLLHFNDNSKMIPYGQQDSDRLYKIRPLIEKLNNNFGKIPLESYLSVDEQMCSTKARSALKQYLPDKPHKWGFKLFDISGVSSFAYKFEVYSGQENKCAFGEPQLGASSNVVVRLTRDIPSNENYSLFFDNYYTSLPLIEYLSNRGILCLGTIRRNRISNCKLPEEKIIKREPRGLSVEQVGNINGVDVTLVAWRDNKIVTLASNFAGKNPVSSVRRYDRSKKEHITIDRPFVIAEYNRHMGGVDVLDCIMGHYKIKLRSKRWNMRLFYHFLDLAMCNSWLLYRKIHSQAERTGSVLNSADFRIEIAETMCKFKTKQRESKRKSELENAIQEKRKRGPSQHVPPKDIRKDQCGHWPEWADKRIRCKYPNCKGFTQTICHKCGVGLCYNKSNNCFRKFHLQ